VIKLWGLIEGVESVSIHIKRLNR